jgi:hypothetical protein
LNSALGIDNSLGSNDKWFFENAMVFFADPGIQEEVEEEGVVDAARSELYEDKEGESQVIEVSREEAEELRESLEGLLDAINKGRGDLQGRYETSLLMSFRDKLAQYDEDRGRYKVIHSKLVLIIPSQDPEAQEADIRLELDTVTNPDDAEKGPLVVKLPEDFEIS